MKILKFNHQKTISIQLLLFLLILVTFHPVSAAEANRISSSCTSNNSLDVRVVGIHNTGSKTIPGFSSKVKSVIVECTCRGLIKNNPESTCPSTITLTVNGKNISVPRVRTVSFSTWWGNAAGEYEGDMFVYRLEHNATVTSLKYNAPSSASQKKGMRGLTAWIVNNDAAKANQPQSIYIDEFHYQHPARSFDIPIKATNAARNMTILLAVSEIQGSGLTRYRAVALNANGTVVATRGSKDFKGSNNASEIRLDELAFNGVPASATKIRVWIESPEHEHGTSFMIGSIAVTSNQQQPTLNCPAGKTVACASEIQPGKAIYNPACPDDTRKPTVSGPTIQGEANCSGAKYTYTFSVAGLSCKQVFTIANNAGPTIFCADPVYVTCEEEIHPAFPEYSASCNGNATEHISEAVVEGNRSCQGTSYTYTYTLTDACGRSTSCEQMFIIEDNAGPTIVNHGNVQVNCESEIIPVFPEYATSCTSIEATETIIGPEVDGPAGCPGTTYTYTYTITDACGRSASCLQVFTIANNEAPTISCKANIQVVCEDDIKHVFPPYQTSCTGNVIENICGPIIEGAVGVAGSIYTYMYTVTDNCGRSASCEQVFEIASGCDACNLQDWLALKKIYETTNGPHWPIQKGWEQVAGDAPPPNCNLANMQGVTLDRKTKRVIDLYLFGLKGDFPAAVGDLSELEYLTFVGVDFMGSSIPSEIGNLKKLKELILADSNIGGQLPAEMALLNNLTLLTVNDNQLSGSYPPGFEAFCSQLTHHRFQCNASISDGNHFDEAWEAFCTTGVCKNYKRASFNDYTIHPNPSTGKVSIQFEAESKSDRMIRVFDNSGKLYEKVSYEGMDDSVHLNLSTFSKGIYIVEVSSDDYTNIEKLIIQ